MGGLILLLSGCLDGAGPEPSQALRPMGCENVCRIGVDATPSMAAENMVAVSPLDPHHLVSVLMSNPDDGLQDVSGPYMSFVSGSRDGGLTWESYQPPVGLNVAPTHPLYAVTGIQDPAVLFLQDGSLLLSGLAYTDIAADRLFVARSEDEGRTFPEATILATTGFTYATQQYPDYPRMALGPDGQVVLMWGRLTSPSLRSLRDLPEQPVGGPFDFRSTATLDLMIALSNDGGRTWTPERVSMPSQTLPPVWRYPPQVQVLSDGSFALLVNDYIAELGSIGRTWLASSNDDGFTWDFLETPFRVNGTTFGFLRVDRQANGDVFYYSANQAWSDEGITRPILAKSVDAGLTWQEFVLQPGPNYGMVVPVLDLDGEGNVFDLYYATSGNGADIEVHLAVLTPGGDLVDVLLDAMPAGTYQPHYNGIVGLPTGAFAQWTTKPSDREDLDLAGALVTLGAE